MDTKQANTLTQAEFEAARQNIMQHVDNQAYFFRLAQLGHTPKTAKEAQALLQLRDQLLEKYGEAVMLAEPPAGPYETLAGLMASSNEKTASPMAVEDDIATATHQLMQNPQLYASAAVLTQVHKAAALQAAGVL